MCRLRNDVDDVLQKVLNGKPQHQLPWRLMLAATLIMLPRYQQAVRSAEALPDRCHDAQPGADRCVLLVDGFVDQYRCREHKLVSYQITNCQES